MRIVNREPIFYINSDHRSNGEVTFIKYLIPNYKVIFDIGCKTDTYLYDLNNSAQYYMFEPSPEYYGEISKKIGDKDNVLIYNIALGNIVSDRIPYYKKAESVVDRKMDNLNMKIEVPITTLDTFYSTNKNIGHIDFIKIDTEGSEFDIIIGGIDTIFNHCSVVQFEYGKTWLDAKAKLADVFIIFKDWYKYLIEPQCLTIVESAIENYKYSNYVVSKNKLEML